MGRIVRVQRPVSWRNPLKEFSPGPYLDGPIFPIQRGSPIDVQALETLRRFYTEQRISGEVDARAFRQFLRNPGKHVFVIWGDIGIGKSWFVRHELHTAAAATPNLLRYEVIDMLHASRTDARETLEQQTIAALQHYLSGAFGSWERGIRPYAEYQAKTRYGSEGSAQEISIESKRIINEILGLRDSARAKALLEVIEHVEGPRLFIAVDNLDKALDEDQDSLTDLVARMLYNARIHLIFPLRSSSGSLLDESKILGFFGKQEMHLSAVEFKALLRPRFRHSEFGKELSEFPFTINTKDSLETLTFPKLLDTFLLSEASKFVMDLAGTNSRQMLDFMHRIVYSNQIDDVLNIASPEACVAALLMHDSGSFSPELSYLINLFDDNRPEAPGNALIRFRVLEFFRRSVRVGPQEKRFTNYFGMLGYSSQRVKSVIALFVGARILKTEPVMTRQRIDDSSLDEIAAVTRIESNVNQYFDKLLHSPWYFICVKRSIHIEDYLISHSDDGNEFISDDNFEKFLKGEEDRERKRIEEWTRVNGPKDQREAHLAQVWCIARDALGSRSRFGKGLESAPLKKVSDEEK